MLVWGLGSLSLAVLLCTVNFHQVLLPNLVSTTTASSAWHHAGLLASETMLWKQYGCQ